MIEKCWYCGKRKRNRKKGSLFCPKCEKLKVKEVPRSELENYYMKV